MDKIEKFLKKLTKNERNKILELLPRIVILNLQDLDIKKLQGKENLYRVRQGNIRIIFQKKDHRGIVINIDYRSKVYKN